MSDFPPIVSLRSFEAVALPGSVALAAVDRILTFFDDARNKMNIR